MFIVINGNSNPMIVIVMIVAQLVIPLISNEFQIQISGEMVVCSIVLLFIMYHLIMYRSEWEQRGIVSYFINYFTNFNTNNTNTTTSTTDDTSFNTMISIIQKMPMEEYVTIEQILNHTISISELKQRLITRGIDITNCLERHDLEVLLFQYRTKCSSIQEYYTSLGMTNDSSTSATSSQSSYTNDTNHNYYENSRSTIASHGATSTTSSHFHTSDNSITIDSMNHSSTSHPTTKSNHTNDHCSNSTTTVLTNDRHFQNTKRSDSNANISTSNTTTNVNATTTETNMATTRSTATSSSQSMIETCCICCEEYNRGDVLRIVRTCKHEFHLECLDRWAYTIVTSQVKKPTCPLCNQVFT